MPDICLPNEHQIVKSCKYNIINHDHSNTATIAELPSTIALRTPIQPSISVDLLASLAFTISTPALAVAVTGVDRGTT